MFNTWMGDPSKVILLEEMVKIINEWNLLDNATAVGDRIVGGLTRLQVGLAFYPGGNNINRVRTIVTIGLLLRTIVALSDDYRSGYFFTDCCTDSVTGCRARL